MSRILILFAHPALEKSRIHKELIFRAKNLESVFVHDLYEVYPELDIDLSREQELLLSHDIILLQHPFYWYSAPAIIKQWLDLVLEHGWAYGSTGKALHGKQMMNVISCGGSREVYQREGKNRFTVPELLAPFNQTAHLCGLEYLPPFVIHGTHRLDDTDITLSALQFESLLVALRDDRISEDERKGIEYINDILPIPSAIQS